MLFTHDLTMHPPCICAVEVAQTPQESAEILDEVTKVNFWK